MRVYKWNATPSWHRPARPRRCRSLRLRSPGRLQRGDGRVGVVALLLQAARVDDDHHVVDGDGRLGDVSGEDYFADAARGAQEDAALLGGGDHRVKRQDLVPGSQGKAAMKE